MTDGLLQEPLSVRAQSAVGSLALEDKFSSSEALALRLEDKSGTSDALAPRLEDKLRKDGLLEFQQELSNSTWDSIKQKIFGCSPNPVYQDAMKHVIGTFYEQDKVKALSSQLHTHDCEIKSDDQAVDIANKVLEATGDKFTRVLKRSEVDEMQRAIRGDTSLTGIGIVVGPDNPDAKTDARPKAQMVFPGTPAQKAGLRTGDILLQVNGKDTKGMSMDDVTKMIKGPKGTEVTLRIDRQGKMLDLKPIRDVVNIPAAVDERVGDVLYVRLFDFMNDKTDQALKAALERNSDAKGLIIDLRRNGGGRVEEMIEVLGIVMRKGRIVDSTQMEQNLFGQSIAKTYSYDLANDAVIMRSGAIPIDRIRRTNYSLEDRPLVLLVDEYSASASELMAGALKDNKAATVVGGKTFGKGIGQRVIDTANGTVVLVTDTKYTSPNGTWAGNGDKRKIGFEPDINVPLGDLYIPLSDGDTQFKKAMEVIRQNIEKKG